MSVSAAYCVSEILSVGRCSSVSEAAERKSLVTGGLVRVRVRVRVRGARVRVVLGLGLGHARL